MGGACPGSTCAPVGAAPAPTVVVSWLHSAWRRGCCSTTVGVDPGAARRGISGEGGRSASEVCARGPSAAVQLHCLVVGFPAAHSAAGRTLAVCSCRAGACGRLDDGCDC